MRRLALVVGVVALGVGGVAYAAIPSGDGNIYACYNNGDGSVRVQNDPTKPCAKNWSPLKWAAEQPDVPAVPVTTTYRKQVNADVEPGDSLILSVFCDEGDVATGGGFFTPQFPTNISARISRPSGDNPTSIGWQAVFFHETGGPTNAPTGVTVNVVCQHTE